MGSAAFHGRAAAQRVPRSDRLYARAIALAVAAVDPETTTRELLEIADDDWAAVRSAQERCDALLAERPHRDVVRRAGSALRRVLDSRDGDGLSAEASARTLTSR